MLVLILEKIILIGWSMFWLVFSLVIRERLVLENKLNDEGNIVDLLRIYI